MKCKAKLARAGCLANIDSVWPIHRHTDGSQRAEVLDQWHEPQIGVEAYVVLHAVRTVTVLIGHVFTAMLETALGISRTLISTISASV